MPRRQIFIRWLGELGIEVGVGLRVPWRISGRHREARSAHTPWARSRHWHAREVSRVGHGPDPRP